MQVTGNKKSLKIHKEKKVSEFWPDSLQLRISGQEMQLPMPWSVYHQ